MVTLKNKRGMWLTHSQRASLTEERDSRADIDPIELGSIYRWKIDILEIDNL
jgi:hypothetical protein